MHVNISRLWQGLWIG